MSVMNKGELEIWWSSLSVPQKERIARKGMTKAAGGDVDESLILYPACTCWWNGLSEERKVRIHDHCVGHHGYLLKDWDDANPYGD